MHSIVLSARVRPGKMEKAVEICRDSIMPAIKRHRGNTGFFVVSGYKDNELLAFTLWESEEKKLEVERNGFLDQQMAKLTNVLAEPANGSNYELRLMS